MGDDSLSRILPLVAPQRESHVEPGLLGEYAEIMQLRGHAAATLLFPHASEHLRNGCGSCAKLVRDVQDTLAAELQPLREGTDTWLRAALARHIRKTVWLPVSREPELDTVYFLISRMPSVRRRKRGIVDEFRYHIQGHPGWSVAIRTGGRETHAQIAARPASQDIDRLGLAGWLVRVAVPDLQPIVAVTGLDGRTNLSNLSPLQLGKAAVEVSPPA